MCRLIGAKPALDTSRRPFGTLIAMTVIAGIRRVMGDGQIWAGNSETVISPIIITHVKPSGHMAINALRSCPVDGAYGQALRIFTVLMMLLRIILVALVAAATELIAFGL